MRHLLDANVLIALTVQEHEHHDRASAWAARLRRFAICPIVEGALVRYLLRLGESAATADDVVRQVRAIPGGEFWPDSLSYVDVDLSNVVGHRQVADAYLVSLARSHRARLATLDDRLARAASAHTLLVPT